VLPVHAASPLPPWAVAALRPAAVGRLLHGRLRGDGGFGTVNEGGEGGGLSGAGVRVRVAQPRVNRHGGMGPSEHRGQELEEQRFKASKYGN
jgi:hypothetical protein